MSFIYNYFYRLFYRSGYAEEDECVDESTWLIPLRTEKFKRKIYPQYLATFIANIGNFTLGAALGWTAPSLPNIEQNGDINGLDANSELATWIGSITPLGCFFSGFLAGYLVDKIGRKWSIIAMAPPFIIGWLIIAFTWNAHSILIGRFILGLCGGAYTLIVPVYASEISQDEIRGKLCHLLSVSVNAGILYIYILGTFVSWSNSCIITAIFPVITIVGMYFMPESPLHLLSKGKQEESLEALMWLRGAEYRGQVREELKSIEASLEQCTNSASLSDLKENSVLKPTLICLCLMFFQQFGGINGVIFYAVDIFKDAGTNIDDNLSAIILGLFQFFVVVLSTLTVEKLGRKKLLIISEFGISFSLLALGGYFYIQETNPGQAGKFGWLPLTSLIFYILTFNYGMEPVPWTMMGELPPPNAKGLVSSLVTAFSWIMCFIITKFFKNMTTALTSYGCYWFFSACSFVGLIYCTIFVPETRGRSAMEIQRYFETH